VSPTVTGAVLDHVAVAVERWSDAWPRYATELGGAWTSGGMNVGFAPAQLRYANGGRVEVLQPWDPADNPFLRRFLDRHGPGPHHLTFKVPDLSAALDAAKQAGFAPVGVDLDNAEWKEAFLHPRQATGIVVQMAQASHDWESPPPEGFPSPNAAPASFVRATHAVARLDTALALFETLLGGTVRSRGVAPDTTWEFAELTWASPPRLRLVAPTAAGGASTLQEWLGDLPGRLHHLVFAAPDAEAPGRSPGGAGLDVDGVLPEDGATTVIEPGDNLGTRLVVV
jgi:methylmalonyl-CoA/ethylmalonyl-CoA epimerase